MEIYPWLTILALAKLLPALRTFDHIIEKQAMGHAGPAMWAYFRIQ